MIKMCACPICFNYDLEVKIEDGLTIPFAMRNDIISSHDDHSYYFCKLCKWKGYFNDLLSEEELKNIKRIRLIDKILN
jgi:hypothetical protein